ncbi:MAG: hypothetical protein ABI183_06125 [Polyangiaceae bacterium]
MASFELSFRARTAASLIALTSLMLVGVSSMVAGCSSSSDSSTPDAASPVCPVTIADAINTPACTTDREVCVVGFICPGELNEIANCTCTGGSWACLDHTNAPITDPTVGTTCTNLGPGNNKACPADEATANFAGCKTSGLICSYKGQTCPGASVANTDTCQCVGAADGGLEYKCDQPSCLAPPTDSGTFENDAGDAGDAH